MRKLLALILALACLTMMFALVACGSNNQEEGNDDNEQKNHAPHISPQYTLQDLLDIAYERRLDIAQQRPGHERLLELTKGRETESVDLELLSTSHADGLPITSEQAIEDVLLLFDVLRQIYGPYIYFGGDEVFAPIFDGIMAELSVLESVSQFTLRRLIFDSLDPVINDNHFRFGDMDFFGASATFFTSDTAFDKYEDSFRHRQSGLLVTEIEGHDKHQVLRLSMNERGNIFYSPVVYSLESFSGTRYTINIIYEDGSRDELTLDRLNPNRRTFREPCLEYVDGVPVVSVMSFGFLTATGFGIDIPSAEAFLSLAEKLHDEPAVIIDARGNIGGFETFVINWLYRLIGQDVPTNFVELLRITYENLYQAYAQFDNFDEFMEFVSAEGFVEPTEFVPFGDDHVKLSDNLPHEIVNNDQFIILLADTFTMSAGEIFANYMFSMENTLVIGQNTSGALINRGYAPMFLPYSGILFAPGRSLFVHCQGHFTEGVGFAPDIWVHGDALVAALTLVL